MYGNYAELGTYEPKPDDEIAKLLEGFKCWQPSGKLWQQINEFFCSNQSINCAAFDY